MKVPFSIPYTSEKSIKNIETLVNSPELTMSKYYSKQCEAILKDRFPGYHVLLTNSCTRALELIALTLNITPADEVIMPSFSYVSVANAFANFGARLVFTDIDPLTMNASIASIKRAVSERTKAIVVMNYGAVGCDYKELKKICSDRGICLIEDNAHGIEAFHEGQLLGSFGDFSCMSFDRLKNISCGEGGAILFKEPFVKNVWDCFENGTNKFDFLEGKVSSYEWTQRGSKFSISEYDAAILLPLLEDSKSIIKQRKEKWKKLYWLLSEHAYLKNMLPFKVLESQHNGHIFYLKCKDPYERNSLMNYLNDHGIEACFHYVPLHSSTQSLYCGFEMMEDVHTTLESNKLLRLPMYNSISDTQIDYIVSKIFEYFS